MWLEVSARESLPLRRMQVAGDEGAMMNALTRILKTLHQCESNFTLWSKRYSSTQHLRESMWFSHLMFS